MASLTGSLVDWGVAWDGGGQGNDVPGMLLELFDRVDHDDGIVISVLINVMFCQALLQRMVDDGRG